MTWIRKDDQMPIHRKVAPLTDAAYRLEDEALCWSSRNLTDGRIGRDELKQVSKRGRVKLAAELVGRGLWHEAGGTCPSGQCPPSGPDGWVIHDYWQYQPSRTKVEAERTAKASRQQRWREAKKGDARRDASLDGAGDASTGVAGKRNNSDTDQKPRPSLPKSDQKFRTRKPDTGPHRRRSGDSVDGDGDALVTPAPSRPAPNKAGRERPERPPPAAQRQGPAAAVEETQKPRTTRPPYAPNGQPAEPPADLLAETKAQLKAAAAKTRGVGDRRERGALDRLRQATPDVPIPLEPEPAAPPEEAPDATSAA